MKYFFKLFIFLLLVCTHREVQSVHPSTNELHHIEGNVLLPKEADSDLESNKNSSLQKVLSCFQRKGGTFLRLGKSEKTIQLQPGDAVYPVCSAGFCRSQTTWASLRAYRGKIILFPPVGARYGFDPYNGKVNWNLNLEFEKVADEFHLWANEPKALRFGYDRFGHLRGQEGTPELIQQVKDYFDAHFFGPESNWQGQKGQRRIYLSFDKNTHVVMHRLNQTNENLENVIVVHLPFRDMITAPLPEWNTHPNSVVAYENFSKILMGLIDLESLKE